MPKVRCKMTCKSFEKSNEGTESEQGSATFEPVMDGSDSSEENKEFFKYTPGGKLELDVINDNIEFQVGKEYYIDITLCE